MYLLTIFTTCSALAHRYIHINCDLFIFSSEFWSVIITRCAEVGICASALMHFFFNGLTAAQSDKSGGKKVLAVSLHVGLRSKPTFIVDWLDH